MNKIGSVLVVDDNRLPRMMGRAILRDRFPEIDVYEAESGNMALELCRSRSIDLALLDINMPGMDGMELAEELRQSNLVGHICFITANIQNYIRERAEELGASFIPKPVSEEKLVELIQSLEGSNGSVHAD